MTDPQSSKPMAAAARKTRRARPSRSSTRISPATSRSRLTTRRVAPTLAPRKRTAKKAPRATTTAKRAKTGTSSKPKPRATIKRSARSAATAVAARTTTSSRRRRRRAALANCSDFYDRGKCIQRSCSRTRACHGRVLTVPASAALRAGAAPDRARMGRVIRLLICHLLKLIRHAWPNRAPEFTNADTVGHRPVQRPGARQG